MSETLPTNDSLYPPPLANVPRDLVQPGLRYRLQVVLVLLALFIFLLVYVFLVLLGLYGMYWAIFPPESIVKRAAEVAGGGGTIAFGILRGVLFFASAIFFAFLFKGLFERAPDRSRWWVEVTEADQPELFRWLRLLREEIGSPMPARVFLDHQVNAAADHPTSIVNLIVPPPKRLLIGLGILQELDVVEFKGLLAHELGHFSQRSLRLGSYANLVYRIAHNMVYGRDRWDNWMIQGFDTPVLSAVVVPVYVLFVESARKVFEYGFRLVERAHRSLGRQMEFNADLVQVGAVGSDAPVHTLFKTEFAVTCWEQTERDLDVAAGQELFSQDVFLHQQRTGQWLRIAQDNPDLGLPPPPGLLPQSQVFAAGEPHPAWDYHPSNHEREQNAKRRYLAGPIDDRPAWLVFRDAEALRREVTKRYLQSFLGEEVEEKLAPAEEVQQFLDDEWAAQTLPARFRKLYANRQLDLGNLETLAATAAQGPVTAEDLSRMLNDVRAMAPDNDANAWVSFDSAAYQLHLRLAESLGLQGEFRHRYYFHTMAQWIRGVLLEELRRADWILERLFASAGIGWDDVNQIKDQLDYGRERLAEAVAQVDEFVVPALPRLPAGRRLASVLPPLPTPPDSATIDTALDRGLMSRYHAQLRVTIDRVDRIVAKSTHGLVIYQETLVHDWTAAAETTPPAPTSA